MSTAHLVHPELRALLADVAGFELDAAGLAPLRDRGGPIPPLSALKDGVRLGERRIPAKADAPDVDILIYTPVGDGPFPAILHIHGGGFVTGDTRRADGSHRRRARETGAVVVSVNYRLAPETRWPGPLEDCHAALNWLHEQAAALNVDATRLAIMGDSAGGGLAAGLALLARDEGAVDPVDVGTDACHGVLPLRNGGAGSDVSGHGDRIAGPFATRKNRDDRRADETVLRDDRSGNDRGPAAWRGPVRHAL